MTKYNNSNYINTFAVYGSFYNFKIDDFIFNCRNLLKISRNSSVSQNIDAIFIMMNPGSGYPLDINSVANYDLSNYPNISNNCTFPINLFPAHPDDVQYFVMEIMDLKVWNNIYVVNLSDLIDPNSNTSFKIKRRKFRSLLYNTNSMDIHSIFSRDDTELLSLGILDSTITKISCWGRNNPKYLTNPAVTFFNLNKILLKGLPKSDKNIHNYYYLKPRGRSSIVSSLIIHI